MQVTFEYLDKTKKLVRLEEVDCQLLVFTKEKLADKEGFKFTAFVRIGLSDNEAWYKEATPVEIKI